MDLVLLHNLGFHRILQYFRICQCLSLHFVMKCVLNNRIRDKLCVQFKMNPFWTFFLVYFYYYHNSCYFCYEMKFLLFFLIFCYQIKCPGILKIYLPKFLSYTHYYCHISLLKYKGTIWTTLYIFTAETITANLLPPENCKKITVKITVETQ